MANGNVYSKPFNEAKVRHLDHFIELTLSGDKPYLYCTLVLMTQFTKMWKNIITIVDDVIGIGKIYAMFGVRA